MVVLIIWKDDYRNTILVQTKSTKFIRPLEMVYFEEFKTLKEARNRERYFKSGQGRQFLKNKLS